MLGATKITMVKHDFETWIKMKERLKWQEPIPQMADHQISSFSVRCLGQDKKAGHTQVGLEDVVRKDLREIGASREGLTEEGFKQIGMEEECTQLGWPQVAWCSSEWLPVIVVVVVHIHMAKKHKKRYISTVQNS